MNKAKLFLENFFIYGLGGIISQIIPLLMLPVVTRLMPGTVYFGLNDLFDTLVKFACATSVMGMYDAMYRMFFEKEDDVFKKEICSTALLFTVGMSVLVCVALITFREAIAVLFFQDKKYSFLVCLAAVTTVVNATNSIISAPARMENKRMVFITANTVGPIFSYAISLPLILKGHYVIALPVASFISGFSLELAFYIINKSWFAIKLFRKDYLSKLLRIAIPLFPNFLIYWIFNSSDKVMITNILSVKDAGVYSAGAKLGYASQLIYTAFAGGWQFFAFSTMKEKNQVETNSKVFEYLGIVSYVATSWVCVFSHLLLKIFFAPQYIGGYIVAPYLFLAPLLQMLFQTAANQFLVIKKTWPNLFIMLSGAIINIVLNLVLIPVVQIEGAAIATLAGYVITDIICVLVLYRMELMIVSRKFIYISAFFCMYFICWRMFIYDFFALNIIAAVVFMIVTVIVYREEFVLLKIMLTKDK